MPRAAFRQSDLQRAIKVANEAGWGEVVIAPTGEIRLLRQPAGEPPLEDVDDEIARWEASHGRA